MIFRQVFVNLGVHLKTLDERLGIPERITVTWARQPSNGPPSMCFAFGLDCYRSSPTPQPGDGGVVAMHHPPFFSGTDLGSDVTGNRPARDSSGGMGWQLASAIV